jgi:2-hydroxychromene-2-carboxylate isomerase
MPAAIDFYFDFSSPYGYLASTQIDALAAKYGREVTWRPHLLGAAFKLSGAAPLTTLPPIKANYFVHDFARFARMYGVPFKPPAKFPFLAVQASRVFYWLADRDTAQAKAFAKAILAAAFDESRDVSGAEAVAEIAGTLGLERAAVLTAVNDAAVKERLRAEVDSALARGVFGSPFIVIDGESFWGADRLPMVERWLQTGGW